jgi:hypothetical protein
MKKDKPTNLEKNILKKVYKYEAKKTYKTILILWAIFFLAQFLIFILGSTLYHVLKQQETLDLLDLFNENFEIIKENFFDVLYVFYVESPHFLLFAFISVLLGLLATLFFGIKNFRKIKKRLSAINKFFEKAADK